LFVDRQKAESRMQKTEYDERRAGQQ
jgi:hypothetical protein